MNLNDFVKICDDAIKSVDSLGDILESSSPNKNLYKKITEICGKNCTAVRLLTGSLIKELAIAHVCNGHETSPYHEILKVLRDAARPDSDDNGNIDAVEWKELIFAIYQNRKSSHFFDKGCTYFDKQEMDLAHSCKNISARGIKIEFLSGNPVISDSSHQKISEEIDLMCRDIGGIQIITHALSSIKNLYRPDLDRFLIYRDVSMGLTTVHAAIPYGYLISLGLKYLNIRGKNKSKSQLSYSSYNNLCAYLRDIISIFEIQPYNMWEDSSVNSRLKNWRKYVEKIREYCLLIEEQNPQAKNAPFRNSAFMSVAQLFTILDECHSGHDFEKAMMIGRNITRGTRDFYVEYICNKKISST